MSWTEPQWAAFVSVLQRGFASREPFTDQDAAVYRLLLEGVPPERAMAALREMVAGRVVYRPRPGEIVGYIHHDPGAPTFAEALALIYGTGGVLAAQPPLGPCSEAQRARAQLEAAATRAGRMHPLVGGFIRTQGLERLRRLPLEDAEYGGIKRAELKRDWEEFVAASEGRQVVALAASNGNGNGELRRLDPLAALGVTPLPLEAGS